MKEKILEGLKNFEKENGVEVILAVESGSRGWGFASEDSDYDVRFVYKHPVERYLDLHPPQTSHSWMDGEIDYEGFDIHKFYDLLLKSNMNIIDWLMQDMIYVDKLHEKELLKSYVAEHFDRRTYAAHNFGLCSKNFHKYFKSGVLNEPTSKRYVYCIRALLSAKYCMEKNALAPLKFDDLINAMLVGEELEAIKKLLEVKKNTREKEAYQDGKWLYWIETNLKAPITVSEQPDRENFYQMMNMHMRLQFGLGVVL
jgi:predicted nucleotidyltransferase